MRLVGGLLVLGITVMVVLVASPSATEASGKDPEEYIPTSTPSPTTPDVPGCMIPGVESGDCSSSTPSPTPTESPPPEEDPSNAVDDAEEGAEEAAKEQAGSARDALPGSSPPPAEEPPSAPPVDDPPEEPPLYPTEPAPLPEEVEQLTNVDSPFDDPDPLPDPTEAVGSGIAALLNPPITRDACDGDAQEASSRPTSLYGSGRPGPVGDERSPCGTPASAGSSPFVVPADVDWTASRVASPLPFVAKAALVALSLAILRFLGIGFTRLVPPEVVNHPHRSRILDFVHQNPGAGETALARALGLCRATARHHVDKLRQFGMVTIKEFRGRPSLFLPSHGNPQVQRGVAALRRGPAQRAYQVLRESPGLDQAALGERLGLSQQRTSQILRALREAELVLTERVGGRQRYRALELSGLSSPAASS